MEYTNYLTKAKEAGPVDAGAWREAMETLLLLLAPSAPHLAEELWQRSGRPYSIHNQRWPEWDAALAADEEITWVAQVNGRLRDRIVAPPGLNAHEAELVVLASENVKRHIGGRQVQRVIVRPGLVNVVVEIHSSTEGEPRKGV